MIQQAAWAWVWIKDISGNRKLKPWPFDCASCPGLDNEEDFKFWGCGFHGHEGKAEAPYANGPSDGPWKRTCPRYCLSDDAVSFIYTELKDYKRGALGNTLEMEAPLVEYLRAAEAESSRWEAEQYESNHQNDREG